MTLGATLGAIGILSPLDRHKTSLLLLDSYQGRRWRMGSKLTGRPSDISPQSHSSDSFDAPPFDRQRRPALSYFLTHCEGTRIITRVPGLILGRLHEGYMKFW